MPTTGWLLTDERGNLLDVTELGRFPSRTLALAVKFRDGVHQPVMHGARTRCDLDHIIPAPEGATAAVNLDSDCRHDHRAKHMAATEQPEPTPTQRFGPHRPATPTPLRTNNSSPKNGPRHAEPDRRNKQETYHGDRDD
jgi:hypothetical protein